MSSESAAPVATSQPRTDGTARVIGMVIGGGVGAFLLVFLSLYGPGRIPLEAVLGLPGVGLALGTGLFSFRRSMPWGVVAAVSAYAWTVLVLWLAAPTAISLPVLALTLPLTLWGALHTLLVVTLGFFVGAGWEKAPVPPEDEDIAA